MNPEKFDLSKLRIASPCSVSWNNMRGDEHMRFCASCELNVYNIAGMTEAGVRELVSHVEGRVCMRLMRRADGSVITQDCPVGLRAYRKRFARFAGATMATVLGLFSISYGQKKDTDIIDASKLKIVHITNDCSGEITGTIMDQMGAVIPGAKIQIVLSDKKDEKVWTESNAEGNFRITHLGRGKYTLKVSHSVFRVLTIENLELSGVECLKLDLELKASAGTEFVGVLAEQEVIGTTSSSISNSIDLRKIQELPVSTPVLTPRKP